jgi:hypothetical protein
MLLTLNVYNSSNSQKAIHTMTLKNANKDSVKLKDLATSTFKYHQRRIDNFDYKNIRPKEMQKIELEISLLKDFFNGTEDPELILEYFIDDKKNRKHTRI